jgi:hypothetical protein
LAWLAGLYEPYVEGSYGAYGAFEPSGGELTPTGGGGMGACGIDTGEGAYPGPGVYLAAVYELGC